jgi:hypothetical protein
MNELFLSIDIWREVLNTLELTGRIQALPLTPLPDGYHFGHQ